MLRRTVKYLQLIQEEPFLEIEKMQMRLILMLFLGVLSLARQHRAEGLAFQIVLGMAFSEVFV